MRALSSSSDYLVDDPKYSFLKEDLKLDRINAGAYNGKWFGSGPSVKSIGNYSFCFVFFSFEKSTNRKFHFNCVKNT